MTEKLARDLSDVLTFLVLSATSISIGLLFDGLQKTPYPIVIGFLLIYSTVGSFVMRIMNIYPSTTDKLKSGSIDVNWGLTVQYWTLWWPAYLVSGKNAKR